MTTTTTTNEAARIFVTTYAIYNAGNQFKSDLHGFWIDVEDTDTYQLCDHFTENNIDEDPELMFTDFENFPSELYSESMNQKDYDKIVSWCELDESAEAGFEYLIGLGYDFDEAVSRADEVSIFEGSAEDYAYELIEDCYNLEGVAKDYFDYEKFARDLELGGDIAELEYHVYVTNASEF